MKLSQKTRRKITSGIDNAGKISTGLAHTRTFEARAAAARENASNDVFASRIKAHSLQSAVSNDLARQNAYINQGSDYITTAMELNAVNNATSYAGGIDPNVGSVANIGLLNITESLEDDRISQVNAGLAAGSAEISAISAQIERLQRVQIIDAGNRTAENARQQATFATLGTIFSLGS